MCAKLGHSLLVPPFFSMLGFVPRMDFYRPPVKDFRLPRKVFNMRFVCTRATNERVLLLYPCHRSMQKQMEIAEKFAKQQRDSDDKKYAVRRQEFHA